MKKTFLSPCHQTTRRHDPQELRRLEAEAALKGSKKNPRRCIICGEIMLFGSSPVCLYCDNPRTEMEIYDRCYLLKVSTEPE